MVQQVVRLGSANLLIEAWATPDAPQVSIEEAVSEVCHLKSLLTLIAEGHDMDSSTNCGAGTKLIGS